MAVSLAALTCMVAFGSPAGAMAAHTGGFGLHDGSSVTVPHSESPHDVAPLTLVNIIVTDLATNQATAYSYDNPAPLYAGNGSAPCSSDPQAYLCMGFGSGGYLMVFAGGITAGRTYSSPGDVIQVSAAGAACGGPNDTYVAAAELDQYTATSSPIQVHTTAVQFDCTNANVDISGTIAYNIVPTDPGSGYYLFGQGGDMAGFGNDNYLAYLDGAWYYNLNAPIVAMAPTHDGGGYWMVGSDGGVYASGDAGFYGSTGSIHLNKPVVSMAATPDGKGYWFVASDGGIFNYGDAGFYGSMGGKPLNKPIVGMAVTPDGKGYWLVASDGGIFSYGDAGFYGSTGALHLNQPVVGMTPTPSGHGYWFVASDGGIFAYGDAGFYGSTGAIHLAAPIVGMTATPDGRGYWFTASDGGVFNYGSAGFDGSLGGTGVNDVVGMSLGM